jgi:D-3-phosphoglycerate dehydrogenase
LGAGVDVFPYEPKSNDEEFISELRGLPNLLLTPHVGGSTVEAQRNIGEYVPKLLVEYINTGNSYGSVNFPAIQAQRHGTEHRMLHIHRNIPGVLSKINRVFEQHHINIEAQSLKTNEHIGYVITDVNRAYDESVMEALKEIDGTIKFRVLY